MEPRGSGSAPLTSMLPPTPGVPFRLGGRQYVLRQVPWRAHRRRRSEGVTFFLLALTALVLTALFEFSLFYDFAPLGRAIARVSRGESWSDTWNLVE